jgi:hypothetical protein
MIEFSHPFERRTLLERAIAENRDGGASYYRSLGMPEDMIQRVIERRSKKSGRPVVTEPVRSSELNAADLF